MGAWGYELFQSDHDFDMVSDLSHELGLTKLEEEAQASAKAAGKEDKEVENIYYSIYGPSCSDPELVRKHLDSGVLVEMIANKEAKLLSIPLTTMEAKLEIMFADPCYVYVFLGACAMTLGCQLPDAYVAMLRKVYTEGGFMPDALRQLKKALFGPDGYKNGVPYDFESKGLLETANSKPDEDCAPNPFEYQGLNVLGGAGSIFNTGMGDSSTSVIVKELRAKHNHPDACAACHADLGKGGKNLLMCSRCKGRKYCSVECQKKHWKVHKKLCEPTKSS